MPIHMKKSPTKIKDMVFSPQLRLSDGGKVLQNHPPSQFLSYDAILYLTSFYFFVIGR